MTVSVQQPQRAPEAWDRLAKALQVGETIYNIKLASDKWNLLKEDSANAAQEKARQQGGQFYTNELLDLGEKTGNDIRGTENEPPKPNERMLIELVPDGKGGFAQKKVAVGKNQDPESNNLKRQLMQSTIDKNNRWQSPNKDNSRPDGKMLPPNIINDMNEGATIPALLEDLRKTVKDNSDLFGPIKGRFNSKNPYNERANTLETQIDMITQKAAKYIEGSRLTDQDLIRYKKMLFQLNNPHTTTLSKIDILDRVVKNKLKSDMDALKRSGYSTSGFDSPNVPEMPKILSERISENIKPKSIVNNKKTGPWSKYQDKGKK